jgi:hypothetical protein
MTRFLMLVGVAACATPAGPHPSQPSNAGGPAASCDANGTWVIDHRMGEGTCGDEWRGEGYQVEWQVEHRAPGEINALHNPDRDQVSMKVEDVGGDCVLDVTWTTNIVAHGTPAMERYRYKLIERAGQVQGSGTWEDWGSDLDERPHCAHDFTVTGVVRRRR